MTVRMTGGRQRRRTRGAALDLALTAAGEPTLLTGYEMTDGSPCHRFFTYQVLQAEHSEMTGARWPCDAEFAKGPTTALFRDGNQAVFRLTDGTLAYFSLGYGWASVTVAGGSYDAVNTAVGAFQALYPATYLDAEAEVRIPITFWTNGRFGPEQRLRMIDTASWAAIEDNYPEHVRELLAPLMSGFEPGKDGQLLLWQGPPGTGKTWALRALASEWLPWAEFSYITDPDAFFVDTPSYMIDVLLHESYEAINSDGDVATTESDNGKWRVLILEDTGELLSATAKEKYGQGLSRLLNVVDGMIGQGLRVLCLVTTNDELGELNAAVRRPGRCASQIVFPSFPADEAQAWLAARGSDVGEVAEPMSLAEMYAAVGDSAEPIPATDEQEGLMADASTDETDRIRAEIVAVAEKVQEHAIGYGETAYDPETGTVFWIHGDWTDCVDATAAFRAIDGVEDVRCDAEGIPDGWPYANVVYPDPAPKWVTVPPEKQQAALDAVVALASEPLV